MWNTQVFCNVKFNMFSSKYTERHWEIVRDYLVRSYFEDVSMPSLSTTSEDEALNNGRSTSSGDIPPPPPLTLPRISPLPELIIEKVNHDSLYDDPEEFYDNLEVKVNKLINNIQRSSQCDDVNDQDTFNMMDTSQDSGSDEDHFNISPVSHKRNVTYTIVNDLHNSSMAASPNDQSEETNSHSSESNKNNDNKNINFVRNDDISVQNSNETYEESITFTIDYNKKTNYYDYSEKKTNLNKNNDESESFDTQHESASVGAKAELHTISAIHSPNLLHIIGTVDASKSPILGLIVNENTDDENNSENSNSEDSNVNNTSEDGSQKNLQDSQSDLEVSTDRERLDTILEEGESQLKDTDDKSKNDCTERDVTKGSNTSNSQKESAQEKRANVSNDPETMRATNRNSFRTSSFSFTIHEADDELEIFSLPNKTAKKHSEIQAENGIIGSEGRPIGIQRDLSLDDIDSEPNINADFVTSTPKSGNYNYSVREIDTASPELVNKSQQCEIDCFETNTRKRRAIDTVNTEHHSMADEDGKSKWESLKERFFAGFPKVYRLCNCKNHSCS